MKELQIKDLSINQVVDLYELRRKKLRMSGRYTIIGIAPRFIILNNGKYSTTIPMFGLKTGQYILKRPEGTIIKFLPPSVKDRTREGYIRRLSQ